MPTVELASSSPGRRLWCASLGLALLGLALLGAAAPPPADSYIDRARLLIGEASRANDFLSQRLHDRWLARLIGQAAQGRLQAAQDTDVPEEVALAHPHLLLMLEHYERAAAAAVAGEGNRYEQHSSAARDEEQLFRNVLRSLGRAVPANKS
jgi:hypothetical protein